MMVYVMESRKWDKVNGDELYSDEGFETRKKNAGIAAAIYAGVGALCALCWVYAAFVKRKTNWISILGY